MAAELERQGKAPPHVGHALRQPERDLAHQEVDPGEVRRRALAPPAQQAAIEDRRSGALFNPAHGPYMGRSSSG